MIPNNQRYYEWEVIYSPNNPKDDDIWEIITQLYVDMVNTDTMGMYVDKEEGTLTVKNVNGWTNYQELTMNINALFFAGLVKLSNMYKNLKLSKDTLREAYKESLANQTKIDTDYNLQISVLNAKVESLNSVVKSQQEIINSKIDELAIEKAKKDNQELAKKLYQEETKNELGTIFNSDNPYLDIVGNASNGLTSEFNINETSENTEDMMLQTSLPENKGMGIEKPKAEEVEIVDYDNSVKQGKVEENKPKKRMATQSSVEFRDTEKDMQKEIAQKRQSQPIQTGQRRRRQNPQPITPNQPVIKKANPKPAVEEYKTVKPDMDIMNYISTNIKPHSFSEVSK